MTDFELSRADEALVSWLREAERRVSRRPPSEHPQAELLVRYLDEELPEPVARDVRRHLFDCDECFRVVTKLQRKHRTHRGAAKRAAQRATMSGHPQAEEIEGFVEGVLAEQAVRSVRVHLIYCGQCWPTYCRHLEVHEGKQFWEAVETAAQARQEAAVTAWAAASGQRIKATAWLGDEPPQEITLRVLHAEVAGLSPDNPSPRLRLRLGDPKPPIKSGRADIAWEFGGRPVKWLGPVQRGIIECDCALPTSPLGRSRDVATVEQVFLDTARVWVFSTAPGGHHVEEHPLAAGYKIAFPDWKILKNVRKHVLEDEEEAWAELLNSSLGTLRGLRDELEPLEHARLIRPVLGDGDEEAVRPWLEALRRSHNTFKELAQLANQYGDRVDEAVEGAARTPRYAQDEPPPRPDATGRRKRRDLRIHLVDGQGVIVVAYMRRRGGVATLDFATSFRSNRSDRDLFIGARNYFRRALHYVKETIKKEGGRPTYFFTHTWDS